MSQAQHSSVIPDDPFGKVKVPSDQVGITAQEVNKVHDKDDCDAGPVAHHHTLGLKNTQASSGDHKHDGVSSKKLMEGIVVTGSRANNAALASLLNELSAVLGFTNSTTV